MTYYDVYIGELGHDGGLDWGGTHSGNIPARTSPFFPKAGAAEDPYRVAVNWIETGKLKGCKTDWGAWAAEAGIDDIAAFLQAVYGGVPAELRAFVEGLAPRRYALVACET